MRRELAGFRVLIVGDWPPPIGGVSIHVRALREAVRKAGASVTVLDIGSGQNELPGVVPSGNEGWFARRLLLHLRRADLVHLHTSGANVKSWVLVASLGVAARLTHVPAIVTFHSGHCPRYLRTTGRALAARAAVASYDRVICVNEEISRCLRRIGAAELRHVVAPAFGQEGLDPGSMPDGVAEFVETHDPIVSAMLAPGRDYGAPELFGAFASFREEFPGAGLVVYGPGTDRSTMARLVEAAHAAPVLRLGQIERAEALAIMRVSDLFVRPTLVDGDALSVREAQALGARVVATRAGARPRGVVLCAPGDVPDLARAMREAMTRTPQRRAQASDEDGIAVVLRLYAQFARVSAGTAPAA